MTTNSSTQSSESSMFGRRNFLAGAAAAAAGVGLSACATAAPIALVNPENAGQQAREFEGRCAFVTGGARGIGFATAKVLAEAGANIVLYDIAEQIELVNYPLATAEDLANAQAAIESLGVQCLAIQGDVRDGARLKVAANQAVEEFGSLDIMVANAGVTQPGTLDTFSEEELDVVLDINLGGVMKTVQAAIPIMREQNSGRMVLVSSMTGRYGDPFFPVYSATKWGVISLTKGTAQLMGPHNVTVNAVAPSLVNTKLLDNDLVLGMFFPDNPTIEAFDAAAREGIHVLPVGFYEPVHVANTIRFICSDAAAYISGDVFDIQAGFNANNVA